MTKEEKTEKELKEEGVGREGPETEPVESRTPDGEEAAEAGGNEAQADALSLECQALKVECDQLKDRFLRVSSDFQNYRKRMEKEKADLHAYANERLICDLLPVLDNFERAVLSGTERTDPAETFVKGIEMVFKQLKDVLEASGLQKIDALGKPFDPTVHHAVMQVEEEEAEPDTVVEVFQTGYSLNAKVIRPSMVKVAK